MYSLDGRQRGVHIFCVLFMINGSCDRFCALNIKLYSISLHLFKRGGARRVSSGFSAHFKARFQLSKRMVGKRELKIRGGVSKLLIPDGVGGLGGWVQPYIIRDSVQGGSQSLSGRLCYFLYNLTGTIIHVQSFRLKICSSSYR